jgi:beta-aspartyl-peptidase (threonine type)
MGKHQVLRYAGALACLAGAGLLLGLFLLWLRGPAPSTDAASRSEAEAAVRAVLDRQVAAWNKGDLEGFLAGYWDSPQLTFFSAKSKEQGLQATRERYRRRYQSEGREMGQLSFEEIQVDVLGPESVLVRGRWHLVQKDDRPGGLFTLLFRKLQGGWRIVHDHTSS